MWFDPVPCSFDAALTIFKPSSTSLDQPFHFVKLHLYIVIHIVQNFYPNDGECVRSDVVPPNEFTPHLPNNGRGVSWRFFLKQNSQGCRGGVTTAAMVLNGKNNGGVRNAAVMFALQLFFHFAVTVVIPNTYSWLGRSCTACVLTASRM
jgi:hypothetical protein